MDPTRRLSGSSMIAGLPRPVVVWGRAAVLGPIMFAAGVVSHVVAGGLLPGPVPLLLVLASCLLGAALLLLGRASSLRLAVGVLAGQTWVHALLSGAGHRGDLATEPLPPLVLDGRGSLLEQYRTSSEGLSAPGQEWLAHQIDHFVGQDPLMLAAHLGGALAVGLFLGVGEDAFWRLVALSVARARERTRRLALLAAGRAVLLGVRLSRARAVTPHRGLRLPRLVAVEVPRLRGPPQALAA